MNLIWNPDWNTGIYLIDRQHKSMFDKANELLAAIHRQHEVKPSELVGFLHEYVDVHFSTEENYMRDIRYPGYAVHKEAHEKLKKQALEFTAHNITEEAFNFFLTWLVDHVSVYDKAFAKYLRNRDPKKSEGAV